MDKESENILFYKSKQSENIVFYISTYIREVDL